jgi:hypothetical protein
MTVIFKEKTAATVHGCVFNSVYLRSTFIVFTSKLMLFTTNLIIET